MDLEYEYSQNELEKTLEFLCIIKNIYIDLSKRNFEIDNFDEIIVSKFENNIFNLYQTISKKNLSKQQKIENVLPKIQDMAELESITLAQICMMLVNPKEMIREKEYPISKFILDLETGINIVKTKISSQNTMQELNRFIKTDDSTQENEFQKNYKFSKYEQDVFLLYKQFEKDYYILLANNVIERIDDETLFWKLSLTALAKYFDSIKQTPRNHWEEIQRLFPVDSDISTYKSKSCTDLGILENILKRKLKT